ncbi:hypothetical protein C8J56DRAFT_495703 [Mycena floridula]|nr:hypothetical protein C8J56DRAFT_495703 [Mycena floridula]
MILFPQSQSHFAAAPKSNGVLIGCLVAAAALALLLLAFFFYRRHKRRHSQSFSAGLMVSSREKPLPPQPPASAPRGRLQRTPISVASTLDSTSDNGLLAARDDSSEVIPNPFADSSSSMRSEMSHQTPAATEFPPNYFGSIPILLERPP